VTGKPRLRAADAPSWHSRALASRRLPIHRAPKVAAHER